MGFLSRLKKKKVVRPVEMVENPLKAIPEKIPDIQVAGRADDGSIMLEIDTTKRRSELYQKVSKIFHYNNKVNVHLDSTGSFFWDQIDGKTDVKEIGKRLKKRLKNDNDEEVYAAVIEYIKSLMSRNLIFLKMPKKQS